MSNIAQLESQLIGCWLQGQAMALIGTFEPADFQFYRHTFMEIKKAYDAGQPVSPVTASGEYKVHELAKVMTDCFPAQAEAHAMMLQKEIAGRKLDRILANATPEGDPYKRIDDLIEAVRGIQRPESGTKALSDIVYEAVKEIDNSAGRQTFQTGIPKLDETATMLRGQLVVIGARPGGGKSAFGAQLAQKIAKKGHRALILTLEMTNTQTAMRMMAGGTKNTIQAMRIGKPEDWDGLQSKIGELIELPISMNDNAKTTADLRGAIITAQPDVVVVDYVQLMRDSEKHYSRREEISAITRKLKLIAKEFDLLMVGLAQINRGGAEGIPKLEDLKESGSFEEDADIVLLLSRLSEEDAIKYELVYDAGDYREDCEKGEYPALIQIAKNRDGATGAVRAVFSGRNFRFYEQEVLHG